MRKNTTNPTTTSTNSSKSNTTIENKYTTTVSTTTHKTTTEKPTTQQTTTKEKISKEYRNALEKAKSYVKIMSMSKAGIYNQLTSEYGERFSAEAAQYAIDNLNWNFKEMP